MTRWARKKTKWDTKPNQPFEKHGAYKALRLLKQGDFPDRRTTFGAGLYAVENLLRNHFNEFNPMQEAEFFLSTLPLIGFLLKKPMCNEAGQIDVDWKWASIRLDKSLRSLVDFSKADTPKDIPNLTKYLARREVKQIDGNPETT